MSPNVPDYLYPSFLKKEKKEQKGRIKMLVRPRGENDEDFEKGLRKRMKNNASANFDVFFV